MGLGDTQSMLYWKQQAIWEWKIAGRRVIYPQRWAGAAGPSGNKKNMKTKEASVVALAALITVAGTANATSKATDVVGSQAAEAGQQSQAVNQGEGSQLQTANEVQAQAGATGQSSSQAQPAGVQAQGQAQVEQQSQIANQGEGNRLENRTQETAPAGESKGVQTSEQRRSSVAAAVQQLLQLAERNEGIGQQVRIIAQEQTQNREQVEASLEKIQSRSGLVRLLIGPNFGEIKNAQALLERNRERIQQLSGVMDQLADEAEQMQLREQIQTLEQADLEIENSLGAEQHGFSLLGWFFKLLA